MQGGEGIMEQAITGTIAGVKETIPVVIMVPHQQVNAMHYAACDLNVAGYLLIFTGLLM